MRVSPRLRTDAQHRIRNATVMVDDYHRARIGLGMIDENCEIVSSLNDLKDLFSTGAIRTVAVIDSRPEVFVETTQVVAERAPQDFALQLVMPSYEFFGVHDAISTSNLGDSLAMDSVGLDTGLAHLALRHATPDDYPASTFMAGLRLGIESATSVEWENPQESPRVRELEEQLLSLLEVQDLVEDHPANAESKAVVEEVAGIDTAANSQRIKELEDQLVTSTTRLDALQRKYDALANSRLGRMTLKHWERNRSGAK